MRETSVSTRTRVIGIVTIILGIAALLDWGILANLLHGLVMIPQV